jgi:Bacteriocin-protection, YdeI or OmpD-Associated
MLCPWGGAFQLGRALILVCGWLALAATPVAARWIADAKREATRERRVAEALLMLRQGKSRS